MKNWEDFVIKFTSNISYYYVMIMSYYNYNLYRLCIISFYNLLCNKYFYRALFYIYCVKQYRYGVDLYIVHFRLLDYITEMRQKGEYK